MSITDRQIDRQTDRHQLTRAGQARQLLQQRDTGLRLEVSPGTLPLKNLVNTQFDSWRQTMFHVLECHRVRNTLSRCRLSR